MIAKHIGYLSLIFLIIICNLLAINYLYIINRKLKKNSFTLRYLSVTFWMGLILMVTSIIKSQFKYYTFIIGVIIMVISLINQFKNYYIKIYNVKSLSKLTSILEDTLDSKCIKYDITQDKHSSGNLEHEIIIHNYRKVPNLKYVISDLRKKISDINEDKIEPKVWSYIIAASIYIILSLYCIFVVIYKL